MTGSDSHRRRRSRAAPAARGRRHAIRPRGDRRRRRRGGARRSLDGPRGGDVAAIILDLAMPGLDGLGVLKAMRERDIAHAGDRADRAGRHRDRGLGDARRRLRFRRQAGLARAAAARRSPMRSRSRRWRMRRAARAGRRPARSSFRDIITRGPGMERVDPARPEGCGLQHPDPDRRRIGRRQGTDRARHPGLAATAARSRSSPSIAAPSRTIWSRASCSATRRAPSPAPPKSTPASSSRRIRERCSSTRSATCRSTCRSSCCAPCRTARSIRSARARPVKVDIRLISATHRDLLQQVTRRPVPRGSVLSPQRLSDLRAAAARPPRRHPRSGRAFHGALRAAASPRSRRARHFGRGADHAQGL